MRQRLSLLCMIPPSSMGRVLAISGTYQGEPIRTIIVETDGDEQDLAKAIVAGLGNECRVSTVETQSPPGKVVEIETIAAARHTAIRIEQAPARFSEVSFLTAPPIPLPEPPRFTMQKRRKRHWPGADNPVTRGTRNKRIGR